MYGCESVYFNYMTRDHIVCTSACGICHSSPQTTTTPAFFALMASGGGQHSAAVREPRRRRRTSGPTYYVEQQATAADDADDDDDDDALMSDAEEIERLAAEADFVVQCDRNDMAIGRNARRGVYRTPDLIDRFIDGAYDDGTGPPHSIAAATAAAAAASRDGTGSGGGGGGGRRQHHRTAAAAATTGRLPLFVGEGCAYPDTSTTAAATEDAYCALTMLNSHLLYVLRCGEVVYRGACYNDLGNRQLECRPYVEAIVLSRPARAWLRVLATSAEGTPLDYMLYDFSQDAAGGSGVSWTTGLRTGYPDRRRWRQQEGATSASALAATAAAAAASSAADCSGSASSSASSGSGGGGGDERHRPAPTAVARGRCPSLVVARQWSGPANWQAVETLRPRTLSHLAVLYPDTILPAYKAQQLDAASAVALSAASVATSAAATADTGRRHPCRAHPRLPPLLSHLMIAAPWGTTATGLLERIFIDLYAIKSGAPVLATTTTVAAAAVLGYDDDEEDYGNDDGAQEEEEGGEPVDMYI